MRPKRIILHHSLTRDSVTVSWGAIRDWHTKKRFKWPDIGYHFGIENLRGQTETLLGRMPDRAGAHCRGHNRDSIGICFVGNFDIIPPPPEAWAAGIRLVKYLMKAFKIQTILGHRELDPGKTCPGMLFDLNKFRKEVKA